MRTSGTSAAFVARRKGRRGLATVEMALVLSLLLWIILGIVEYGWLLLKYQEITGATRQGTRIGAPYNRTNADIESAIANSLQSAGLDGYGYTICIAAPGGACGLQVDTLNPGDLFEVRISLPYNDTGGASLGMPLIPKPGAISSRLTMVREGI